MSLTTGTKNTSFYIFTLAVVIALVLPPLLQHGMFMDGIQYAVVSKNLAEGHGSFWFPFLSSSWEKQGHNYFLEHPPLVYGMQSLFFKLFHGGFYSERMYCLFMLVVCIFLIIGIWRLIFKEHQPYRSFFWLPVLLWIITPSVYWSFINNMQENTVSMFVLASLYFSLKAIQLNQRKLLNMLVSGLCVFLATLSKGVPGLFPLVTVFLAYVVFNHLNFKKTVWYSFILMSVPFAIYACLILFNSDAKESLMFYLNERLLVRISENHQVDNRLITLFWLLTDLIVPFGVLLILYFIFKAKKIESALRSPADDSLKKWFLFFTLLGLCGVLPLCLTHVQRAVYFVPAIPFFAIALSVLGVKGLERILVKSQNQIVFNRLKYFSIALLVLVLSYSIKVSGNTYRDAEVLDQVHQLAAGLEPNTVVGVPYYIYDEWDFQFYLLRYHNITLDPYFEKSFPYKMFEKDRVYEDTSYSLMPIELEKYRVYKRKY